MKEFQFRHYTRELALQQGQIIVLLDHPEFNKGLVNYISQFGKLLFGHCHSTYFTGLWRREKSNFLETLANINSVTDPNRIQPVSFKLFLMRRKPIKPWRWPALINEISKDSEHLFLWNTGMGRMFVAGLMEKEPWTHIDVLLFQDHAQPLDKFLHNAVAVQNDQQLHELLRLDYDNPDPAIELRINQFNKQGPRIELVGLYDGDPGYNFNAGDECLEKFRQWQAKYPPGSVLNVYTDWPELITDSLGYWKVNFAGPSLTKKHLPYFSIGQVEIHVRNQLPQQAELHVFEPRKLDVAELLPWGDPAITVSIGRDMSFAWSQPTPEYLTQLIELSYIN